MTPTGTVCRLFALIASQHQSGKIKKVPTGTFFCDNCGKNLAL
jgi:hypothetical protein